MFAGNSDRYTVQINHLEPTIEAQYIKIVPDEWRKQISLRLELYGCSQGEKSRIEIVLHICIICHAGVYSVKADRSYKQKSTTNSHPRFGPTTFYSAVPVSYGGSSLPRSCRVPVGVQSGWLPDTSFSASSHLGDRSAPFLGRLHNVRKGKNMMAWTAGRHDKHKWWQVDLGKTMNITMVATQGGWDCTDWVTSYFVAYSQDGLEFHHVTESNQTKVCGQRLGALPGVASTQSTVHFSVS